MRSSLHRTLVESLRPVAYLRDPLIPLDQVILVQKFGGSSLSDPALIRAAARRVAETRATGVSTVVVVSAECRETDELLTTAGWVGEPCTGPALDLPVCFAETRAAALMCIALHELEVPAEAFTGPQAGIFTDDVHTQASIIEVRPDRIRAALRAGRVPVVCGAQGESPKGDITCLGRGESDTTAVALAAVLGAEVCELHTDVGGVFSADPTLVPEAQLLSPIGYEEMLAMCAAGCPTPATRAVELAQHHKVPVCVRSAHLPGLGSWIVTGQSAGEELLAVVSGPGPRDDAPTASNPADHTDVSLIGAGVSYGGGLTGPLEDLLFDAGILTLGPARVTELSCSFTVPARQSDSAVRALHSGLDLGRSRLHRWERVSRADPAPAHPTRVVAVLTPRWGAPPKGTEQRV